MKRLLKALAIIVLLGLTGLIVLVSVMTYRVKRINPWPERLAGINIYPTRPMLTEEQVDERNGYYFLRQITNSIGDFPTEELTRFLNLGFEGGAYTGLNSWIVSNQNVWSLWAEAAQRTNGQVATFVSFDARVPYITLCLKLFRCSAFLAERDGESGGWLQAQEHWNSATANALLLARGGALINHLVSFAGYSIILQSLRRAAWEQDFPDEFMAAWISALKTHEEAMEPFVEAIRYERLFSQEVLELVYGGDFNEWLSLSDVRPARRFWARPLMKLTKLLGSTPEQTSYHYDAIYSHIVHVATNAYQSDAYDRVEAFAERAKKQFWLTLVDDPVGRITTAMLLPALRQSIMRQYFTRSDFRGTALSLAVVRFQRRHDGNPPDTLEQLVPGYISVIPEDPFLAGQPFRYRRDGANWVVYSVGPNQKDDGGVADWRFDRSTTEDTDVCYASDEFARRRAAYYNEKKSALSVSESPL